LPRLKYLAGYPAETLASVRRLIAQGRLSEHLASRYPERHEVRSDKALFDYTLALKNRYLRNGEPVTKVLYDNNLTLLMNTLGTHCNVPRVQGRRIKSKREIRVATLFRDAPAEFLKMIVVHELAHLREREHDKAFYQLCTHMEPDYHQLEFDLRLYLTQLEQQECGSSNRSPI
jgi:predicted metal-dependent hydrolase